MADMTYASDAAMYAAAIRQARVVRADLVKLLTILGQFTPAHLISDMVHDIDKYTASMEWDRTH